MPTSKIEDCNHKCMRHPVAAILYQHCIRSSRICIEYSVYCYRYCARWYFVQFIYCIFEFAFWLGFLILFNEIITFFAAVIMNCNRNSYEFLQLYLPQAHEPECSCGGANRAVQATAVRRTPTAKRQTPHRPRVTSAVGQGRLCCVSVHCALWLSASAQVPMATHLPRARHTDTRHMATTCPAHNMFMSHTTRRNS